jgi:REP element-mobilizing transposase RayT
MPRRNIIKPRRAPNTTFHVYNRGANRRTIFLDDADRRQFLQCFRQYISPGRFTDSSGRPYRSLAGTIDVLAYCLMPNHYHLVVHQHDATAMSTLMKRAMTAYVRYFNHRYGRVGVLFASPYRAAPKYDSFEIQTAIAYVHLNHPDGANYKFSSHNAYTGVVEPPDWLNIQSGLAVFGTRARYERFIAEYAAGR